jgi:hypothetical protein
MRIYEASDVSAAREKRHIVDALLRTENETTVLRAGDVVVGDKRGEWRRRKPHIEQELAGLGFRSLRHVVFASHMQPLQHRLSHGWYERRAQRQKGCRVVASPLPESPPPSEGKGGGGGGAPTAK